MQIDYNVTGEKRKSLVGAISKELNIPTKYLGAPTFAYEVGGYHIDKAGTVTGPDNLDLKNALHQQGFDAEVLEPDRLVIDMPMTGFTPEKLDNLAKLIIAKAPLLKAALGAEDLPIQQIDEDGGKLRFPWFTNGTDAEAVKAYTHLVVALCEMAKTQKRITATEKPVENEKYAFRCFLLRLGFIGTEYKEERKILLSKLSGSSAFKNPVTGGANNE